MATLAVVQVAQSGTVLSFAAAGSGGDKFAPGDTTWLEVLNVGGADRTITIDSPATCSQGSTHDVVVVCTAGEGRFIGPFPAQRFAGADGLVSVTYDAVTSLSVRPKKI